MTREKVIKGLECCLDALVQSEHTFAEIGIVMTSWQDREKRIDTIREAIAFLKAQEPRVMTVEELCRARGKPAWFEARNGRLYTGWVIIYDVQTGLGITGTRVGVTEPGHVTIWPNVELYGQKWRCWTGEPTEEQRRATPWATGQN